MNGRSIIFLTLVLLISGCASTPQGPDFSSIILPEPPENKGLLVVYRDYAEPTGLAAKIFVSEEELFSLPQKSFAYVLLEPRKHSAAIKWPALSGTPGWNGEIEMLGGKTSYYQLVGSSGGGFYFKSSLKPNSEELAASNLNLCCKLITEMKDQVVLATDTSVKSKEVKIAKDSDSYFDSIEVGMLPEEVIKLAGSPSKVSNKSTGKMWIPFYFGTDTRRTYWSYKNIGYVVFTRNEYTGSEKVVETKYDKEAP